MAKVYHRTSKRDEEGLVVFEGTSEECTEWVINEKDRVINGFLSHETNCIVAAAECFGCDKSEVTEEMMTSDELVNFMKIDYENYYRVVEN